jgi:hypothetical protein
MASASRAGREGALRDRNSCGFIVAGRSNNCARIHCPIHPLEMGLTLLNAWRGDSTPDTDTRLLARTGCWWQKSLPDRGPSELVLRHRPCRPTIGVCWRDCRKPTPDRSLQPSSMHRKNLVTIHWPRADIGAMTKSLATEAPWPKAAGCNKVVLREAVETTTGEVSWHWTSCPQCAQAALLRIP